MVKVMPFQFLSLYFGGDNISAVEAAGVWYLRGNDFELVGLEGKPYAFKNKENAEFWLQHNAMLSMQSVPTAASMIARIEKKKTDTNYDDWYWLDEEITHINRRNATIAGTEQTWLLWGDLFIDGGGA